MVFLQDKLNYLINNIFLVCVNDGVVSLYRYTPLDNPDASKVAV